MRRTVIALLLAAAVVGIYACAADAPSAPKPGAGGGTPSTSVSVQLFTSNSNPKAGTCTLIEALVNLNGNPVPDGTTVNFTTDFGTFGQNGLALVSVTTIDGQAVTALCGPGAGTAKVKASATIQGKSNTAQISINFQPDSGTLPFVSFCNPSFGPKSGGTQLVLNGGRFFGSPSTTRAVFTVNGVSKDAIVQSVTSTQITVLTPGFPEIGAPSAQAPITLFLGTNQPTPVQLSLPSCFVYGTADSGTPTVTAILPASGTNEGNTRVTIIGAGFSTSGGVQVFFGSAEATVVSVSYNQVVALSPPAFGAGAGNLNATVPVTVKNIASGIVSNATVTFSYSPAVRITSNSNGTQSAFPPFSPVTIFGQGFQAPVAVTLAGIPAFVQSVSATEIVVLPSQPLLSSCDNITGDIAVVNIDTGDGATGGAFTYVVPKPSISNVTPGNSCPNGGNGCPTDNGGVGGGTVTIDGVNLPASTGTAQVKFGSQTAFVTSASISEIVVTAPITAQAAPACTGTNIAGTPQVAATVDVTVTDLNSNCSVTATQAFQYILPCVVTGP
jgi:hypothetical protein